MQLVWLNSYIYYYRMNKKQYAEIVFSFTNVLIMINIVSTNRVTGIKRKLSESKLDKFLANQ